MEEQEKRKSESQDHPCEEQTHSLSVVLSVEEEASEMPNDWGLNSAEEDSVANGFGAEEEGEEATPGLFPGTTYWSVSEGPDFPLLLSPVAGPSRAKRGKRRVERASRSGNSRIPGRDHRRYYHEYWRAEFLMDFDAQRHRMLCMVCGSSLATLKLSTIKRHIQQKHPESLLWNAADKEAIRVGWDSHLRVQGAPSPARPSGPGTQSQEGALNSVPLSSGEPTSETPGVKADPAPRPSAVAPPEPQQPSPSPEPPALVLERYVDDSLHAWFRQEFLMEYRAQEGRLVCMVCSGQLPSLHLEHIKRHVLDRHPVSLLYSAVERHSILHTWAQKHESESGSLLEQTSIKPEPLPDGGGASMDVGVPGGGGASADGGLPGDSGAGVALPRSPSAGRLPKRWRLGYLVARCPTRRAVVCMVCSQTLPTANAKTFRQHIRLQHPDTATLSRPQRRALADAWSKQAGAPGPQEAGLQGHAEDPPPDVSPPSSTTPGRGAGPGRLGPHAGKDQQRNYQERWRTEYLMEYDSRRRGLVCVVCGAALATLKVSTIKRHIQQVHPLTLVFSPAEREEALRNFSHPAVTPTPTPDPDTSPLRTLDSPPGGGVEQE
ncbi:zinc finger translocation-associated protein-like isoform X1 [Conger conger]|uniref:zinc finger translocation-associated protein-like isoform X1 n=1 Tax=Conger conger TaxID=82655 RepID=UPI002A59FE71|nr:zinc finger translocation-associated protein-like isoform X1 [Conger conger]